MLHFIKSIMVHFEKQSALTQWFLRICRWTILKGIFWPEHSGENRNSLISSLTMLQNRNLIRKPPWYIKSTCKVVFTIFWYHQIMVLTCWQNYREWLLLATYRQIHSNSRGVSYLPWQNKYSNLKTAVISSQIFCVNWTLRELAHCEIFISLYAALNII